MNKYPKELQISTPLDLKLGIKSSMSKIKSPIALLYFLWVSNNKPSSLAYSSELNLHDFNSLILQPSLKENLFHYLLDNKLTNKEKLQDIDRKIDKNPLFSSQIESLIVAFELVYKIAKFSFVDKTLSFSAERSSKNEKPLRYMKIINYSSDMDIIELFVSQNKDKYLKILFSWLMEEKGTERNDLSKLFTLLSDTAIFRLRISEGKEIKFNMAGIYENITENNSDICLNDYRENMGSLRVLRSVLREEFNYFLKYTKNDKKRVQAYKDINLPNLEKYAKRLATRFALSNIDLWHIEKVDSKNDKTERCFVYQHILFGAPGIGKSHFLKNEIQSKFDLKNTLRVTFYPSLGYGSFVGCFKPVSHDGDINYKYVAGPLMKMIANARLNENIPHLLIIEEINRANAAAVFGDTFQLLDRDANGESMYPLNTSKEQADWLESQNIKDFETLYIPANLSIIATMNASDEGVAPLDTAFKRRFDFLYMDINSGEKEIKDLEIRGVKWNRVRKGINEMLGEIGVNEDKMLGAFFLGKRQGELEERFKNKVLMYLFEDIGRIFRARIFNENIKTFSKLLSEFDKNGFEVFKSEALKELGKEQTDTQESSEDGS